MARLTPEIQGLIEELLDDRPLPGVHPPRDGAASTASTSRPRPACSWPRPCCRRLRDPARGRGHGRGDRARGRQMLGPRLEVAQERGVVRADIHAARLTPVLGGAARRLPHPAHGRPEHRRGRRRRHPHRAAQSARGGDTMTTAPATIAASPAPPAADPVIRLDDVDKTFGEGELAVHALKDASLGIERGQFVVVLGPSGSGKTTLMNLIGGIEPVTAGTIAVDGEVVSGLDEDALTEYRREKVGFVFQFFNLIPTLTALENVTPRGRAGRGRGERRCRVARRGRPGRPRGPLPQPALGRGATARGHRPCPGQAAHGAAARRAHRLAGPRDRPAGAGCPAQRGAHVRVDGAAGHTQLGHRRMADRVIHLHSGSIVEDTLQPEPADAAELHW